jgi:hypothetical protein
MPGPFALLRAERETPGPAMVVSHPRDGKKSQGWGTEVDSSVIGTEAFGKAIMEGPYARPRNWMMRRRSRLVGRCAGRGANCCMALRSSARRRRASRLESVSR